MVIFDSAIRRVDVRQAWHFTGRIEMTFADGEGPVIIPCIGVYQRSMPVFASSALMAIH